jgi:hypothetical protein
VFAVLSCPRLNSARVAVCGSTQHSADLPRGKRNSTRFAGAMVDFGTSLEVSGEPHPHRDSKPRQFNMLLVAIPTNYE